MKRLAKWLSGRLEKLADGLFFGGGLALALWLIVKVIGVNP